MDDPKRQAWMYVVAGVVGVVAAIYFLSSQGGTADELSLVDWAILAMGIVALYRGARMFLDLRKGAAAPPDPGKPTTVRRKLPKPGDDRPKD